MKESDWKIFKRVRQNALEKFCAAALSDVEEAMGEDGGSSHGKYLYVYKLMENADKRLSLLFDGYSRSRAAMQLMLLRGEGLVKEDELEGMSREFVDSTTPIR